jgi:antitoxin component YwqK of YwqJK toxin-antitoxin module
MRHGQGKFYYQDGGMYDGEWRDNKMSGYGKLFYKSGKIAYEGGWLNEQFTGRGTLYNEEPDLLA